MISSAFQTILTSLLVGLMMLGNATAWVHHGTCNDAQCQVSKPDEKSRCGSTHCCHSHRVSTSNELISLKATQPDRHDSMGCAACHAATTGGMTASHDLIVAPITPASVTVAVLPSETKAQAASVEQLRLRGPPVLSA